MIDILIRFEFCFTDRRGRNQSGAVMRGCRIGQIIIGIDQIWFSFSFMGSDLRKGNYRIKICKKIFFIQKGKIWWDKSLFQTRYRI